MSATKFTLNSKKLGKQAYKLFTEQNSKSVKRRKNMEFAQDTR